MFVVSNVGVCQTGKTKGLNKGKLDGSQTHHKMGVRVITVRRRIVNAREQIKTTLCQDLNHCSNSQCVRFVDVKWQRQCVLVLAFSFSAWGVLMRRSLGCLGTEAEAGSCGEWRGLVICGGDEIGECSGRDLSVDLEFLERWRWDIPCN